jgi:DNA-binding CsgD family transcriptional regulator
MTPPVSKEARVRAVLLLIRLGWRPPRPSSEIVHRIAEDIAEVEAHGQPTLTLNYTDKRAMGMAASGYTVQECADMLGLGFETIKHQRKHAMQRLGAKNMPHAIAICFRSGILSA